MKFGVLRLVGLIAATAVPQTPPQTKSPPNPADLCTIQGVVVKAGTGEPLKKAWVDAVPENSRIVKEDSMGGSAETDSAGRFEITGLQPGRYHFSAHRNGYVWQNYGQKDPSQPLVAWTLSPGQNLTNVTFQLTPSGVISGHVYDEDGEPMVYAQVEAMRYGYENGHRLLETRGHAFTNDLGEFRMFGLEPGQYFVMAKAAQPRFEGRYAKSGYAPFYYPGVADPGRATPVSVSAGSEFADVDFNFQLVKAYSVRGQIESSACGAASAVGEVNLMPVGPGFRPYEYSSEQHGSNFEFKGLSPGSYLLVADSASPEGVPCRGQATVEVTDGDLDGITLTISAQIEIKGRLRVEGQLDPPPGGYFVSLSARNPTYPYHEQIEANVPPDGNFSLPEFPGGPFDLSVRGIPASGYLKSMRADGTDLLATGLTIDPKQELGMLEIVVSPNGATLQGVVSRDGQPVKGARVALIPDPPNRNQKRLYKSIGSDSSGRFVMQGIAPGDYKVFAWEKIEEESYESPDVLGPYENQGQAVHINEGSNNSIQLDLIPASEEAQ